MRRGAEGAKAQALINKSVIPAYPLGHKWIAGIQARGTYSACLLGAGYPLPGGYDGFYV